MLEYEEKIAEFFGEETANTFLEALVMSSHVMKVEVFYRFNVLSDLDDNKFVDCAFASNAHFIVSNDKIFKHFESVNFPKLTWMNLDEFSEFIERK